MFCGVYLFFFLCRGFGSWLLGRGLGDHRVDVGWAWGVYVYDGVSKGEIGGR